MQRRNRWGLWVVSVVLAVGAVTVLADDFVETWYTQVDMIGVYFTQERFGNEDLHGVIEHWLEQEGTPKEELRRSGEAEIEIASYEYIDWDLALAVQGIADTYGSSIAIRVLLSSEGDDTEEGRSICEEFLDIRSNIEVRRVPNMHHTYAIIGPWHVLTGSAPWTAKGLRDDANDLIVIPDEEVNQSYRRVFKRLWDTATVGCQ